MNDSRIFKNALNLKSESWPNPGRLKFGYLDDIVGDMKTPASERWKMKAQGKERRIGRRCLMLKVILTFS